MSMNSIRFRPFLLLLLILVTIVFAVPNLGVQRDFNDQLPRDAHNSYSAVVKFNDMTIPGDRTKMSDAQFINLAKVAYDQMVNIWSQSNLNSAACPGAMIVLESEGTLYFASSVRHINGIDINDVDKNIKGSIGWYQWMCDKEGMGTHRNGGRCAEPNVLRLYGDQNGLVTEPDNPLGSYKPPPTTDTSPRVAVWGRNTGALPNQGKEHYFLPCRDTESGYGCMRMAARYGFKPVSSQDPDSNGQDEWEFTLPQNNRGACPQKPF